MSIENMKIALREARRSTRMDLDIIRSSGKQHLVLGTSKSGYRELFIGSAGEIEIFLDGMSTAATLMK